MQQNQKITVTQATLLFICLRMTFTFFIVSTETPPANQDVWIALLFSVVYVFILFSPFLYLNSQFPRLSLPDYAKLILGNFLSKIFILLYVGFTLFLAVINLVNLTLFIGSGLLPETPNYLLLLFIIIPAVFSAYKGIVTIARTGQIIFPVVLGILFLTMALGINLLNYKTLLPIFRDSSLLQLNNGAFIFATGFHDAILLFFLAPNLQEKTVAKTFILSLFLSTLIFVLVSITPLMALGIEQARHANFPFYEFLRQIKLGDFIERIEALPLSAWIMTELFKLSVYSYYSALCLNEVIRTKSPKKFLIPFSLLAFFICINPKIYSIDTINTLLSSKVFPKISALFIFVLPLILVLIYKLKKIFSD